jgi:hypothetical protein
VLLYPLFGGSDSAFFRSPAAIPKLTFTDSHAFFPILSLSLSLSLQQPSDDRILAFSAHTPITHFSLPSLSRQFHFKSYVCSSLFCSSVNQIKSKSEHSSIFPNYARKKFAFNQIDFAFIQIYRDSVKLFSFAIHVYS